MEITAGALRTSMYVAVTGNWLSGIDEIVKISALIQGICSRLYIDSTKLIFVAFTR